MQQYGTAPIDLAILMHLVKFKWTDRGLATTRSKGESKGTA